MVFFPFNIYNRASFGLLYRTNSISAPQRAARRNLINHNTMNGYDINSLFSQFFHLISVHSFLVIHSFFFFHFYLFLWLIYFSIFCFISFHCINKPNTYTYTLSFIFKLYICAVGLQQKYRHVCVCLFKSRYYCAVSFPHPFIIKDNNYNNKQTNFCLCLVLFLWISFIIQNSSSCMMFKLLTGAFISAVRTH